MEAVMKNASRLAGIIICTFFLAVSCRQLFTESMGSSLERDKPSISSSASLDDLLDIARSRDGADQEVAEELLDALADKTPEEIDALSIDEKTDILNLGGAAAIDLGELANLSNELSDNPDNQNELIRDIMENATNDVDTTVLEQLLSDEEVLTEAEPEAVVVAAAAIVADVSAEVGAERVMDILADPSSLESSGLTREQQNRLEIVINASEVMETRDDADDVTIGDFDLLDLLRGNE